MIPFSAAYPACQPKPSIQVLRQKLALLEQGPGFAGHEDALALNISAIDAALAGGLARPAVHEISARCEAHNAAATRFACGLAGILLERSRSTAAIWVAQDLALFEHGTPYAPGLVDAGIAPEWLTTVVAPRRADVLWAMEEALRCRAIGVVIAELGTQPLDHVAARRLSLAAVAGTTLGLILRAKPDETPCACATRWIISSAPAGVSAENEEKFRGIGPPRLCVQLVRNHRGHPGAWLVEWNSVEQRFELATHSLPMGQAAIDRPPHAAVA
jgi:protein ImuA